MQSKATTLKAYLDELPLEPIGEAQGRIPVKKFMAHHEQQVPASKRRRKA